MDVDVIFLLTSLNIWQFVILNKRIRSKSSITPQWMFVLHVPVQAPWAKNLKQTILPLSIQPHKENKVIVWINNRITTAEDKFNRFFFAIFTYGYFSDTNTWNKRDPEQIVCCVKTHSSRYSYISSSRAQLTGNDCISYVNNSSNASHKKCSINVLLVWTVHIVTLY